MAEIRSQDASLDAGAVSDETYLEELGYKQELNRLLGIVSAFAIQFSLISVTAGMWSVFGVGLTFFGPAMILAWLVGGVLQMLVGMAMGELVSAYPLAGGVYQIVGRLTGRVSLAWQTGWWLIIAHTVAAASLAVFTAPYIAGWFGIDTSADPGTMLLWVTIVLVVATAINYLGVRIAAIINNVGVVTELLCGAIVIGALLFVAHPTQPISFLLNDAGTIAGAGGGSPLMPFLFALLIPGFVISSFDSSGNAAEETHNAAKNAPKGVIVANFVAFVIGTIFMALLLLSIQDLDAVMKSPGTAVVDILKASIGDSFANIFVILGVLTLIVCIEMLQLTAARIIFAQARDGQLPLSDHLRKLNKEKVPAVATGVTFVMAMIFVLWAPLMSVLAAMTAIAWAAAYGVAVFFGMLHWKKLPKHPWGYGSWSGPIFIVSTIWSVVLCVAMILSDPTHMVLGFLGVIVVGFVIYYLVPASRRGRITGVTHDDDGNAIAAHSAR